MKKKIISLMLVGSLVLNPVVLLGRGASVAFNGQIKKPVVEKPAEQQGQQAQAGIQENSPVTLNEQTKTQIIQYLMQRIGLNKVVSGQKKLRAVFADLCSELAKLPLSPQDAQEIKSIIRLESIIAVMQAKNKRPRWNARWIQRGVDADVISVQEAQQIFQRRGLQLAVLQELRDIGRMEEAEYKERGKQVAAKLCLVRDDEGNVRKNTDGSPVFDEATFNALCKQYGLLTRWERLRGGVGSALSLTCGVANIGLKIASLWGAGIMICKAVPAAATIAKTIVPACIAKNLAQNWSDMTGSRAGAAVGCLAKYLAGATAVGSAIKAFNATNYAMNTAADTGVLDGLRVVNGLASGNADFTGFLGTPKQGPEYTAAELYDAGRRDGYSEGGHAGYQAGRVDGRRSPRSIVVETPH